jgi:hypothetical protein
VWWAWRGVLRRVGCRCWCRQFSICIGTMRKELVNIGFRSWNATRCWYVAIGRNKQMRFLRDRVRYLQGDYRLNNPRKKHTYDKPLDRQRSQCFKVRVGEKTCSDVRTFWLQNTFYSFIPWDIRT